MCAIVLSPNIDNFIDLYNLNIPRGAYATGIITLIDDNLQQITKISGTLTSEEIKSTQLSGKYFIGHLQAPTSSKRSWSYETSHPFESVSWSVVHNGVLTNDHDLRKIFELEDNPVDTAIIPMLLQKFTEDDPNTNGFSVVKKVLSSLQGTFAVCIVDTDCNEVFIARQGSVLHYNDQGEVSSLYKEGFRLLPEGVIMRLENYNSWQVVDVFSTTSPFLFL